MMKLLYSQNSPYARRARMAIRAVGLLDNVNEIDINTTDDKLDTLLSAGPGGKVPVLETSSSISLCESLVITHYLDTLKPGILYPASEHATLESLQVESIASVLLDSLFTRSREQRRNKEEHSPAVIELEQARALRCYQSLEKLASNIVSLSDSSEAASDSAFDASSIAVIAALGYSDWRHPDDLWRKVMPHLAAWYAEVSLTDAAEHTKPIY